MIKSEKKKNLYNEVEVLSIRLVIYQSDFVFNIIYFLINLMLLEIEPSFIEII